MSRIPKQTAKRGASRKISTTGNHSENLTNDIQGDSPDNPIVISERTTFFTEQQTSFVEFAQPSAAQSFIMPTSLSSLGVASPQYNNLVTQDEPKTAVAYYESGIILASQNKPGQALLSLYQAWSLGLTPLIQLNDLPILQQLYASLMSLIRHMQKIEPQYSPELNSFIAQATVFNNILLRYPTSIYKQQLSDVRTKALTLRIPMVALTSPTFFSPRNSTSDLTSFENNLPMLTHVATEDTLEVTAAETDFSAEIGILDPHESQQKPLEEVTTEDESTEDESYIEVGKSALFSVRPS